MGELDQPTLNVLVAAIICIGAIAATQLSRSYGVPALVLFLGFGWLLGSDGLGVIYFADTEIARTVGSLALAIILFEGGLQTRVRDLQAVAAPASLLATFGVAITAVLTGVAAYWLVGLGLTQALLLGAIVSSTDAAAVFSVMRGVRASRRVHTTIETESGLNDPAAIFLTVMFIEVALRGTFDAGELVALFVAQIGLGAAGGVAFGYLSRWLLGRVRLPSPSLYSLLALACAGMCYAGTALIGGSGLLAVFLQGMVLRSGEVPSRREVLGFHEGIAWLAQITMFVILGLYMFPTEVLYYLLPGLALSAFLMLVARPISVFVCTVNLHYTLAERTYISWVGLRGAVPIVLATFPLSADVEGSRIIFDIVVIIVVTSALFQGTTVRSVLRLLKLESDPARTRWHGASPRA